MGFLEDLKKKLSTPGAEAFSRARFEASRPPPGRPEQTPTGAASDVVPPYLFDAAAAARRRRRRLLTGIAILVAILAVAGGTVGGLRWFLESRTVQKRHVDLTATAPDHVTSGEDVTVRVHVRNASRVAWENVTLALTTPQGFQFKNATPALAPEPSGAGGAAGGAGALQWALGSLPPRAAEEVTATGRLLGDEGSSALFSARFTLTPANRPGTSVEKTAVASVVLAAIPLDLTIDVPRVAASGTPITIRVVTVNRLAVDLTDAEVRLETPEGFTVSDTVPPRADRELAWTMPPLPPQGENIITVAGVIAGDPETAKPFSARVGFLTPDGRFLTARQVQRSLTIERAALSLSQVFNSEEDLLKVNPGDEVAAQVQYKNTGSTGLREVIVKLQFEGTGLDARSVKVKGGFFDSRRREITWSAASSGALRALRPGEGGELTFSFRILPPEALPFTRPEDRNFSLRARATADSPDIPVPPGAPKEVSTDLFEILLNSVPGMVLNAFFDDGRAGLPVSTGPLPPQVGVETILTVRARLTNTSNDVIDATERTVLPEGVRWVGKEYHTTGDVRFNDRTRDVVWTVPLLGARAGVALPSPEFAFQVGITPSLNEVGREVALTRGHTLEGTDAFTTARLRAEAEAVTTATVDPKRAEVVR